MSHTLTDRYRRWFVYEQDAHRKTLASLQAIPDDRRADFQKAIDLFAHIVAARRLWLYRLGIREQAPRDLFPQAVPLETLTQMTEEMHAEWTGYLEGLDDAEVAQVFEYTSMEGDRFRNRIEDILTQLFGHSWYHRGQIAALLRAGGAEPAPTDLVFWAREPVAAVLPDAPES